MAPLFAIWETTVLTRLGAAVVAVAVDRITSILPLAGRAVCLQAVLIALVLSLMAGLAALVPALPLALAVRAGLQLAAIAASQTGSALPDTLAGVGGLLLLLAALLAKQFLVTLTSLGLPLAQD
jgi:hypothetical protein